MDQNDFSRRIEYFDVDIGKKEILEFQGHGQVIRVCRVFDDLFQFRQEQRLAHQVAEILQEHAFRHFFGGGDLLLGHFFVPAGNGDDREIQGDDHGQDGDEYQGQKKFGFYFHFSCRSYRKNLPSGSGCKWPIF